MIEDKMEYSTNIFVNASTVYYFLDDVRLALTAIQVSVS